MTLYNPLKFGTLTVPNRIFMAPLTRCRANAEYVSSALMTEYYVQRASAGLIIAEATMVIAGERVTRFSIRMHNLLHPTLLPLPMTKYMPRRENPYIILRELRDDELSGNVAGF